MPKAEEVLLRIRCCVSRHNAMNYIVATQTPLLLALHKTYVMYGIYVPIREKMHPPTRQDVLSPTRSK